MRRASTARCNRVRVSRCALAAVLDRCAYAVLRSAAHKFLRFDFPCRRFGPLESVRVFPGKTFAFVNYLSPQVGRSPKDDRSCPAATTSQSSAATQPKPRLLRLAPSFPTTARWSCAAARRQPAPHRCTVSSPMQHAVAVSQLPCRHGPSSICCKLSTDTTPLPRAAPHAARRGRQDGPRRPARAVRDGQQAHGHPLPEGHLHSARQPGHGGRQVNEQVGPGASSYSLCAAALDNTCLCALPLRPACVTECAHRGKW